MAHLVSRLRRALTLSPSLLNNRLRPLSTVPNLPHLRNPRPPTHSFTRTVSFRSSAVLSDRRSFDDGGKISPDEILFEGCDYNHWLITMDFPKDPKPTAEEMVETYVQTAAKVFGSVEEAKKRIYACSTTTYQGFQALMDEQTSEKFRGLPGVVFILPDSYIDPVNKEYGGDKYENGVITPRPPPVQYGRQGRYGDRNRNYDRPRYDRPRDSTQQGYPQQDGRGYAPEGVRDSGAGRRDSYQGGNFAPGNIPPQERRDFPQGAAGGNFSSQEQRNFAQGPGGNFPSQEHRTFPQGQGGNFPPQEQRNFPQGPGGNFPSQEHVTFPQGQGGNFPPQEQRSFPQRPGGNFHSQEQRNFQRGQGGDYSSGPGGYRQGPAPGSGGDYSGSSPSFSREYRQGTGTGYNPDNRQGLGPGYAGDSRQGPGFGQEQSSTGPVEGRWQGKY